MVCLKIPIDQLILFLLEIQQTLENLLLKMRDHQQFLMMFLNKCTSMLYLDQKMTLQHILLYLVERLPHSSLGLLDHVLQLR